MKNFTIAMFALYCLRTAYALSLVGKEIIPPPKPNTRQGFAMRSHFESCPNAAEFRERKKKREEVKQGELFR